MKTYYTFLRIFAILTMLMCALALTNSALAATSVTGGTFHVNSTADNLDKDNFITLREAMLIARGGTGANGLNRHVSTAEKKLLNGCTFIYDGNNKDWYTDNKCGKGSDTIVFNLTGCPC